MQSTSANPRSKRGHIDHLAARDLLLATDHGLPPHDAVAVASHWLQDMGSPPIYGGEELKQHWEDELKPHLATSKLSVANRVPFPSRRQEFTFIDLFAGIGGFRIALQRLGGKSLFASEIDPAAQRTYDENFGAVPFGDIRDFTDASMSDAQIDQFIPTHDVLAAGFPCQPFSKAGVSARNARGDVHGFDDDISGTLFFDIVRIARVKKPKVLFLENVKNLVSHDGGRTFSIIRTRLEGLGYHFEYSIINSARLVPQRRVRTYIVASRLRPFQFDTRPFERGEEIPLESGLESDVDPSFTISDALWAGHRRRTKANIERGVGFTAFTADLAKPANTLVARYGKDGKECLVPQGPDNPRLLTPRECARLQGFPEKFLLPTARTVAYRQFGNSVAVPVIYEIGKQIRNHLG